jgi:glucokinase
MTKLALVGDIGGTNSRFGLVEPGSTAVSEIAALKNDDHASLEDAVKVYLGFKNVKLVDAMAVAVAAPVTGETVTLTNRDWTFSKTSLRQAANAGRLRLLNDFEALAYSLPHLEEPDLFQIGGTAPEKPGVKIVIGPGTGLGMATLVPLPNGGWMPVPGEVGHIILPVVTQEEFDLREAMTQPGVVFESEDAVTGTGLPRIYRAVCKRLGQKPSLQKSEDIILAALEGGDKAARKTLDHFTIWLARLAGDAAMTLQAYGGVYLAGGIAPTIAEDLRKGPFREVFQEKGRLAHFMRPIPVYVILEKFAALRGCAAALAS